MPPSASALAVSHSGLYRVVLAKIMPRQSHVSATIYEHESGAYLSARSPSLCISITVLRALDGPVLGVVSGILQQCQEHYGTNSSPI